MNVAVFFFYSKSHIAIFLHWSILSYQEDLEACNSRFCFIQDYSFFVLPHFLSIGFDDFKGLIIGFRALNGPLPFSFPFSTMYYQIYSPASSCSGSSPSSWPSQCRGCGRQLHQPLCTVRSYMWQFLYLHLMHRRSIMLFVILLGQFFVNGYVWQKGTSYYKFFRPIAL